MKNYSLVFTLFFLLIISCKKEDTSSGDKTPGSTSIIFNVNKSDLLKLVNAVRASGCECGNTLMPAVLPINWNDQLARAAYDHSVDMNQNNYFSHTSQTGSNAGQRITATGYNWTSYGENIAKGPSTEQAVMNGWLSSEDHCKNIMNAGFKEMGVGRDGIYWTQVFGSR